MYNNIELLAAEAFVYTAAVRSTHAINGGNIMKKRMMAMLMTAILVIASIPFTAFAEEMPAEVLGGEVMEAVAAEAAEAEAIPAAAGEEAVVVEETDEETDTLLVGTDDISTWKKLNDAIAATQGSRKTPAEKATTFTLTKELKATDTDGSLIIGDGKNIILDLNGYSLDRGLTGKEAVANGTVICVNYGASLTLKGEGGVVTGGNTTSGGGGIYVVSHGNLTMKDVWITGNKATHSGGGLYCEAGSEFHMEGGMITGNTIILNSNTDYGAGVCFQGSPTTAGQMFVGGNSVLGNNKKVVNGVETIENIYSPKMLTIGNGENGAPKPAETMSIGITFGSLISGQKVRFTENASSGDEKYFKPDKEVLKVAYNSEDGGYLELQYPKLTIDSDKSIYNIGEQIKLTFKTNFVDAGTKIVVTDGTGTMKVPVKEDGTAAITVNAVTAGSFNYKAFIEDTELEDNVFVTVKANAGHTVTFETNGGTPVPEKQQVIENGKAARPQKDPAKDGYEFAGWYADAGCTNPYNFNMPIDRDITIFAKWTKKADPTPSSDDSEPLFTGNWGNPVKSGKWTQDVNGLWSYTSTETFRNTWGYIENPFAKEGQHKADWFYFDQYGHMLTGWQLINGKWYYLNPTKDGTLGACFIGPGKTPDGWLVDENGACIGQ